MIGILVKLYYSLDSGTSVLNNILIISYQKVQKYTYKRIIHISSSTQTHNNTQVFFYCYVSLHFRV